MSDLPTRAYPGPQTPCPRCGGYVSRVIDVDRELLHGGILRTERRRTCQSCRGRYTTIAEERTVAESYSSAGHAKLSIIIEIAPIYGADIPSS